MAGLENSNPENNSSNNYGTMWICSFCLGSSHEPVQLVEQEGVITGLKVRPCKCRPVKLCCLSCSSKRDTKCSDCHEEFSNTDYDSLEDIQLDCVSTEGISSQAKDDQTEQVVTGIPTASDFPCDAERCDQVADGYCVPCDDRFCVKHMGCHKEIYPSHSIVNWIEYQSNKRLHRAESSCKLDKSHTDHACQKCFKRACSICGQSEEDDVGCPEADDGEHSWGAREKVLKLVNDSLRTKVIEANRKIEELESLKTTYTGELRDRYRRLRNNVTEEKADRKCDIERHSQSMNDQIDDHYKQDNEICAEYKQQIDDRIATLEEFRQETKALIEGDMLAKFDSCPKIMKKIKDATEEPIPSCDWKQPLVLVSKAERRSMKALVKVPKQLEHISLDCATNESCCYDVAFQGCGTLWVATDKKLKYYDFHSDRSHLHTLSSCENISEEDFSYTSVAPHNLVVYFTMEASSEPKGKVKALLRQCDGSRECDHLVNRDCSSSVVLFEYNIGGGSSVSLAASEGFLALANKEHNQVIIYNTVTGKTRSHALTASPSGVCFHPNGNLLVTDGENGTLSEYKIDSEGEPDLNCPLVCPGLAEPDAICVGDSGLIYVKSTSQKLIYVITEGTVHRTLSNSHIHTTPGGITTYGDQLVMAGYGEKDFRRFKFVYED